eukprot:TRINITY_DN21610_c0_g3_i1.p1 TRINITY_DN21610_c0_g3~~TRINITY_DN21610_c0_g3_i1.p1  ORF type:complete len:195 (+),score=33.06 TRINITY_DN21610_c0_g3_i1:37-621(+)
MSRTNWLSTNLPDDVRDALSQVAQSIQQNPEAVFGDGTITFDPMAHEDIHMTILFIGDGLHRLKFDVLNKFHQSCQALGSSKEFPLRFTGYSLFPPEKNNLIVARFTTEKPFHAFTERLVTCTEQVGLQGIRAKHNFEPHITLGKIGANKEQIQKLIKRGLQVAPLNIQQFKTDGYYLSGATPPQAYLDWKISY